MGGPLPPSTRIGDFVIEGILGAGGMGEVYRATQVRLGGRPVALKVLTGGLATDPEFSERFLREATIMRDLEHPAVVTVYDAGSDKGLLYLAMRLLESRTLRDVLGDGPLPPERAITLLGPLADALDHAHRHGVVHRDIKPANILLDAAGRPYLADFGIAKAADGNPMTRVGQTLGTPRYMAPEQASGVVGPRGDQYSLACVAFEMLTGTSPFPLDDAVALIFAHTTQPPPTASTRNPALPAAVDGVFQRALAKRPVDRFETATEMVAALAGAVRAAPTAATGVPPSAPTTGLPPGLSMGSPSAPRSGPRSGPPSGPRSNSAPSYPGRPSSSGPSYAGGPSSSSPSYLAGPSPSGPSYPAGPGSGGPSHPGGPGSSGPSYAGGPQSPGPAYAGGPYPGGPSYPGGPGPYAVMPPPAYPPRRGRVAVVLASIFGTLLLVIGGLAAIGIAADDSDAKSPGTDGSRSASATPSAVFPPPSRPEPDAPVAHGRLLFAPSLDGTGRGFLDSPGVTLKPEAGEIRHQVGALQLEAKTQGAFVFVQLDVDDGFTDYVGDMELAVRPGTRGRVCWSLRWAVPDKLAWYWCMDTTKGTAQFQRWDGQKFTPIGDEAPVADLDSGRLLQVTVVVEDQRLTMYLDGKEAGAVDDTSVPAAKSIPGIELSTERGTGLVHITGVRIWALSDTTKTGG